MTGEGIVALVEDSFGAFQDDHPEPHLRSELHLVADPDCLPLRDDAVGAGLVRIARYRRDRSPLTPRA